MLSLILSSQPVLAATGNAVRRMACSVSQCSVGDHPEAAHRCAQDQVGPSSELSSGRLLSSPSTSSYAPELPAGSAQHNIVEVAVPHVADLAMKF